jgi:2-polyprenyl-3-methyl-5-hydroxy-6-metoxy-1,4-benzoquinol methylase
MQLSSVRKRALRSMERFATRAGYELEKVEAPSKILHNPPTAVPPPCEPAWPLPRGGGQTDDEIREAFAQFEHWHYAYAFEGGLSFDARHVNNRSYVDDPERPLQRFRHFMPYLLASNGGTLEGLKILDIACNSGFWSLQCALLGAQVTGFDARQELIDQANLVKSVVGVTNVEFRVLDFFAMTPEALGTFDVVLNLGILYHLPQPLDTLARTRAMATKQIVLDTGVHPTRNTAVYLRWEDPYDIHAAADAGVVARPSRTAVDLMLTDLGVSSWFEIPVRSAAMPPDYIRGNRTSWLINI